MIKALYLSIILCLGALDLIPVAGFPARLFQCGINGLKCCLCISHNLQTIHLIGMLRSGHLRGIDISFIEIIYDEITELIVGHAADKTDLLAQFVHANGDISR